MLAFVLGENGGIPQPFVRAINWSKLLAGSIECVSLGGAVEPVLIAWSLVHIPVWVRPE